MAGTLVISTLSDGTNSTSTTNAIQGSAKAWVNFNGTAGTIRASYNVSSLTVNGTGNWTITFTNAFADSNYVAVFGTQRGVSNNGLFASAQYNGVYSTTQLNIAACDTGATPNNAGTVNCAIFR